MSTEKPTHVWVFDENHRVYHTDPKTGRSVGGPIYAHHWRQVEIIGETSRSWLLAGWRGRKVAKRDAILDRAVVDEDIWVHDNRQRLSDAVRFCRDVGKLRAVAAILDGK